MLIVKSLGIIPFDHSANQIDQVDSEIKDLGYIIKEKVLGAGVEYL